MATIIPDQNSSTNAKAGLAPNRQETIAAVDNSDLESDTNSEADISAFTTSVTSSVYDYVYENGRRYHRFREGAYFMPNDQAEQDRLDMLHHIFTIILGGKLFRAPINEQSAMVLDIGTGTGLWAVEMAEQYPGSTVLGTDLSPIQPEWVPSNCSFLVDDIESPWSFDDTRPFDYIHQRNMVGSIGDWDKLFSQAFSNLAPGGWYEVQEFAVWFHSQDGPLAEDSALNQWQKHLEHCSTAFGKRLNIAEDLEEHLKKAGFADVRHDMHKIPVGSWAKDPQLRQLGQLLQVQMVQSVEPVTLAYFSRILKWEDAEIQSFMTKVKKEFMSNKKHIYAYCHLIYGRKP